MTMAATICLRRLICLLVALVTSSGEGGREKRQGSTVFKSALVDRGPKRTLWTNLRIVIFFLLYYS